MACPREEDENTGTILEDKHSVPWKVVKQLGDWVPTRTFSSYNFSQAE